MYYFRTLKFQCAPGKWAFRSASPVSPILHCSPVIGLSYTRSPKSLIRKDHSMISIILFQSSRILVSLENASIRFSSYSDVTKMNGESSVRARRKEEDWSFTRIPKWNPVSIFPNDQKLDQVLSLNSRNVPALYPLPKSLNSYDFFFRQIQVRLLIELICIKSKLLDLSRSLYISREGKSFTLKVKEEGSRRPCGKYFILRFRNLAS